MREKVERYRWKRTSKSIFRKKFELFVSESFVLGLNKMVRTTSVLRHNTRNRSFIKLRRKSLENK